MTPSACFQRVSRSSNLPNIKCLTSLLNDLQDNQFSSSPFYVFMCNADDKRDETCVYAKKHIYDICQQFYNLQFWTLNPPLNLISNFSCFSLLLVFITKKCWHPSFNLCHHKSTTKWKYLYMNIDRNSSDSLPTLTHPPLHSHSLTETFPFMKWFLIVRNNSPFGTAHFESHLTSIQS